MGFQAAPFYAGGAAPPGAAGLLAHRFELDALGPFLLVTAIGLGVLYATGAGRRPGEMRGRAEAPVRDLSGTRLGTPGPGRRV